MAHERCGKVIVALDESELPGLDELERRGRENGVPGLRRLTAAELREMEPHAAGVAALHSPNTGIADFGGVARALAEQLRDSGVWIVATGAGVTGVSVDERPRAPHATPAGRLAPASRCSAPAAGRIAWR